MIALVLSAVLAAEVPDLSRPVTDLAGVLSADAVERIAQQLEAHRVKSGVQLAVLTVDTTDGEPIDSYALRVATRWGGGEKRRDDGGLFVLAVKDRKMRIELGYGLEGRVSDGTAMQVLEGAKDRLRASDYDGAVEVVTGQLIELTAEGLMSPEERARFDAPPEAEPLIPRPLLRFLIFFGLLPLATWMGRVSRRKMDARERTEDGYAGMSGQQLGALFTVASLVVGIGLAVAGLGWEHWWAVALGLVVGYFVQFESVGAVVAWLGSLVFVTVVLRGVFGSDPDLGILLTFPAQAFFTYVIGGLGSAGSSSSSYSSSGASSRRRDWDDTSSLFSSSSSSSSSHSSFSSSSSSSSSHSSSSSSWGGRGGSFGGGGASSGW